MRGWQSKNGDVGGHQARLCRRRDPGLPAADVRSEFLLVTGTQSAWTEMGEAARAPAGLAALVRLLGFTLRGTRSHRRDQSKGRTSSDAAPAGVEWASGGRAVGKLLKQTGGGSEQVLPADAGDMPGSILKEEPTGTPRGQKMWRGKGRVE